MGSQFENENVTINNSKKDNSEVIAMQEKYEAGQITKDAFILYMIDKLRGYYESLYRECHMAGIIEHEDYVQTCMEVVVRDISKYDARKAAPTTFFKNQFLEAFNRLQKDSGGTQSRHYEKQKKLLNKVAQEYGYSDMNDPRLTPEKLSKLAGAKTSPLKTVIKTKEYVNSQTTVSLDEITENHNFESPFRDPAVVYLENEQKDSIASAVEALKLTSFDEFLRDNYIVPDDVEKLTIAGIVNHLKAHADAHPDDEVARLPKKSFNAAYINTRVALLRKRLSDSLRKFSPVREMNIFLENPEQATDSDLRRAFDLGDLF